jgi:pimeloyl-ACP methyl ester carboxylesterase
VSSSALSAQITPTAVATHWLTVAGVRMRLLTAGTGTPIVLLHGIGGSADEWLPVVPHLARHYRLLMPDAPGHGLSEKPPPRDGHRYDLSYYVDAIRQLLDILDVQQAPFLAISGGGPVALTLALDDGDRVSRLVLVAAAGLGREVAWSYRLASLPLVERLFRPNRQGLERVCRAQCYDPAWLTDEWIDHRLQAWSSPGAVDAFFATLRAGISLAGQRTEFTARLSTLRQPTLLIWGREDPIIPVAHAMAAARAIPGARLCLLDRCGHLPMCEHPEAFATVVLDFLAGA